MNYTQTITESREANTTKLGIRAVTEAVLVTATSNIAFASIKARNYRRLVLDRSAITTIVFDMPI